MHHVTAARVGARIRELRLQQGRSQGWIETHSTVPKARLSRYENGHVMPSIETVDKIAAALGLTLSDVFRGIS